MVQITAGTGSSKRLSDEYPETLNLHLNPTQQHGTIPAAGRKDGGTMDATNQAAWETLTPEEKRRALYDRQVATLKTFLEHGVITQAQHGKSLHDLTVKMGYADE